MGTIVQRSSFPHKPLRDLVDILGVRCIFVFAIKKDEFLLTYNLDKKLIGTKLVDVKQKYKNTIRIHRKKRDNVFFTINALTKIEEQGKIDWKKFKNSLILKEKSGDVSVMDINLLKVIKL